jgi:proline iminopeptidase
MKKHLLRFLTFTIALTILSSCAHETKEGKQENASSYFDNPEPGVQNGGVKMISIETPKGKFNVWTKRVGNNPAMKILLLNGGPGCTHEYFECFESFLPKEGIEFIYYDQLTCGNSDNPKDTSLFDLNRYVEEVEQVRIALNLDKTNFYLLGHSWGGILAMQYALKYQDNLKGLIISDMMASCPLYGKYADDVLAKQMDPVVLDSIHTLEKKEDTKNPRYMQLLEKHFYSKHICRIYPYPEPVKRSFDKLNMDLYVTMQGPSEFGISGKLTHWDVSSQLKNIHVPTLVIGATYDSMDPKYMEWMSKEIPGAQFLLCSNGSHMCMWDDQETYINGLVKFVKGTK